MSPIAARWRRCSTRSGRTQPPLRGVVHAASAIDDGLAAELDGARASPASCGPSSAARSRSTALTRDDPIELFLLFSSATTLLGAPGQGVYVAANMALEALARRRRAEGRPALAVAWGPIEDAGYLADRPETRDALARRLGAKPMPAAQALAGAAGAGRERSAGRRLSPRPAGTRRGASCRSSRRRCSPTSAPMAAPRRGDDSLIERLAGLDPEEALALLKTVVAEEAANILRLPAAGIDPLRPLSEMGMDSLMAVELRLALESRLRVDLPLMSLAEGTSVASIADAARQRRAGAAAGAARCSSLAERYEAVDDERLAAVGEPPTGSIRSRSSRPPRSSRWRQVATCSDCRRRPRRG